MPRPIVALTASSTAAGVHPSRVRVNDAYVRAIQSVGLVPLIVPPSLSDADAARVIDSVAGLVLSGGEDVSPALYGAAPHPATEAPHPDRDATERALALAARQARRPTLAICRGLQLLNVALGGTLVQDLATERPSHIQHPRSAERASRVHRVRIASPSRLADAICAKEIAVNSLHHQAVDRVAPSLCVVAHAPDDVVEACESTEDWWAVGVQWHPEELVADAEPWDRRLFEAFRDACR